MSTLTRSIIAATCVAGVGFSMPAYAAEGPDDLWKVTATMTMEEPISMSLPAFSSETCAPPQAEHGPPPMQNGNCTVDRYDRSGDRVEFAVTCNQQGVAMTGTGWTEKSDADHYKGAMHMSGNAGGQGMKMSMSFSGTRIGHCTADTAPES